MSEFLRELTDKSLSANGYYRLPGGLIIQWGELNYQDGGWHDKTFPIAFPTLCASVVVTRFDTNVIPEAVHVTNISTTTFQIYDFNTTPNAVRWIAIGY